MANQIKKERFILGLNSEAPKLFLEPGEVRGGENMRRAGNKGGWKPRLGSTLRNTTAEGSAISELFVYRNPFLDNFEFLSHVGNYFYIGSSGLDPLTDEADDDLLTEADEIIYEETTQDPLTQSIDVGYQLDLDIGSSIGFGTYIGEQFFYANGVGSPVVYSGGTIFPRAVLVYDASEDVYTDWTASLTNLEDSDYVGLETISGSDALYICSSEPADSMTFKMVDFLGSITRSIMKVFAWRSGAWTDVGILQHGFTTSGDYRTWKVSWQASTLDEMKVVKGEMGYWYKVISFTLGTTMNTYTMQLSNPIARLTNKWNGIFEYPTGCLFYDASEDAYVEGIGKVTNESQSVYLDIGSGTTSDYLYIKAATPLAGLGFGVVEGNENSAAVAIDLVETWTGSAWSTISDFEDLTKEGSGSFVQTGQIFWDFSSVSPARRIVGGDPLPGFWYRFSWNGTLSSDVRLYLTVVAEAPEALLPYSGVVEFDGRAVFWGDPNYPNRLRYSEKGRADRIPNTNFTPVLGDSDEIVAAKTLYEFLFVGKRSSTFILSRDFDIKKVSSKVGIISADTLEVVEVGTKTMQNDKTINVAIWLDIDGVYRYDLEGLSKISTQVMNYFDPVYSDFLGVANLTSAKAYNDVLKNEYHLLIGGTELVYNYLYEVWYPVWDREIPLSNALTFRGADEDYRSFGCSISGFVLELESGLSDRNTSNAEVAISHSIRTRALTADEAGIGYTFNFRGLWIIAKADNTSGTSSITAKFYKNFATSATTLESGTHLNNAGYNITTVYIPYSSKDCHAIEVELLVSTLGKTMEIYEIMYEYGVGGKIKD